MRKFSFHRIAPVYWLLVVTDLVAILFESTLLHSIVKPTLMPALVLMLLSPPILAKSRRLIVAGLIFSWLGDVFLLFEKHNSLFFICGLAAFLITHICYIIYFLSIKSEAPSLLKKQPLYFLLVASYGAGLVWFLLPFLGELKIPVILYATFICAMLLCSIHIFLKVKTPADLYFLFGATLFVLSDTLLAINKFYQPLPFAAIWVMLSYCTAQYFIVLGFIRENTKLS